MYKPYPVSADFAAKARVDKAPARGTTQNRCVIPMRPVSWPPLDCYKVRTFSQLIGQPTPASSSGFERVENLSVAANLARMPKRDVSTSTRIVP
jgi:hypothetical protein